MGTEKIKEEIKDLWTNTIKIYFDLLLKLNIDYIKLIGANGDDYGNEIIYIDSIVEGVSRLIPMKAAKNTKKLSIDYCGIIHLLKNNINYVESDLHEIINNNKKALFNIKMIRNNIEHNPHCLMGCTGKNKDGNINITFGYHDKDIDFPQKNYSDIKLLEFQCDSSDIETIIKELNILFDKIQKEVKKALKKYDSEYKNTPYFKDLLSINYKELNALYDNGDFALISKLINKTNKI